MGVDFGSFLILVPLAGILGVAWPYAIWRQMEEVQAAIEVAIFAFLCGVPLLVFTYMGMRLGMPLADVQLAEMDAAIGFRAREFLHVVDRYPKLATLLSFSYGSFTPQIVFVPAFLCLFANYTRAYAMVLALIIIGAMSAILGAFFPAIGAFAHYGLGSSQFKNISSFFGYHFLDSFYAVRNAADFTLALDHASGIVTFPSVHAAVAVLAGWGAWGLPWLRWPLILLNIAMWFSALTHGAHYLVDLFAGTLIACAAISAGMHLMRVPAQQTRFSRVGPAGAGVAR